MTPQDLYKHYVTAWKEGEGKAYLRSLTVEELSDMFEYLLNYVIDKLEELTKVSLV